MSDTAVGGSSVSYRPAGSSTRRSCQDRRSARSRSSATTSTSVKSRVAAPAHADRARSADLAFSSSRPDGWSWRSRNPAEVPTNVEVTPCSANPYSFRPAPSASRSVSPSCAAKPRNTPKSVPAEGEDQRSEGSERTVASPEMRSAASSAGEACSAAFSASRTSSSTWSVLMPERATTPTPAVPSRRRAIAITVSERVAATPLVVSVLPAQRRFAVEDSSAMTTVSPPALAAASARSTVSCGVMEGPFGVMPLVPFFRSVEHPHRAEERGRRPVAHRRHLPGLALPAVERPAQDVRLGAADRLHRVPEVGRRRLVGHVLELAVEAAVPDPVEPLARELEVVPLHVDRPRLVAEDVDAVLDAGDQLVGRRAVLGRLQGDVGHPLQRHVAP